MTTCRDLPGPKGRLIGGNLADFESDRLAFIAAARRYGELVRFDEVSTLVFSPDLAHRVLIDADGAFDIPSDLLGRRLGPTAMAETRRLRPLLNAPLRRQRTGEVAGWVRDSLLHELSSDPRRLDEPLATLERVVFTGVARAYFGADGAPPVVDAISELLEALDSHFGNPFALPAFVPTRRRHRMNVSYRNAERVVLQQLVTTPRNTGPRSVAQDVSAAASRTTTPRVRVAQMLIGSLLAARRIPAAAACWMLHETTLDFGLQRQLQPEALAFENLFVEPGCQEAPAFDARQFPLAMATALEALRLHPPTWLLHRKAVRATTLGPCTVPEGHNLLISPWLLHRNERVFARAERFDPSRWAGISSIPRTMLAFGKGPHGCPGSSVAITAMTAVLLTLTSRWELRPCGPVTADPRSTLVPRGLQIELGGSGASPGPETLHPL